MMSKEDLQKTQLRLLRTLANRVYHSNSFYRERMDEMKVKPGDVKTLADVSKLPFMTKSDLREHTREQLFIVPNRELVRIHASSGTTGKPTIVGYTKKDVENWSESVARGLVSAGVSENDIMQIAYTYGLFSGGLGMHYAAERMGATVVPASTGNSQRQIDLIKEMDVTVIACTPSYLLHLGEVAEKMGTSIKETRLRIGILGAEPWSEKMRDRIEDWLGVSAIDIFGTSELSGPLWCECTEKSGIHVWADIALIEVIDPKTLQHVRPGEKGELVVTMLQKEALPIIRYRTGDITVMYDEECPCGRVHPRIGRIQGRVDDMLIIRGINVFPSQVEYSLMTNPELGNEFQIVVDRRGALDEMLVRVELRPDYISDKLVDIEALKGRITAKLRHTLNISPDVELVETGTLPRFEGKAKRVVDKRTF
jgi:phenylacetate-CoA ligase